MKKNTIFKRILAVTLLALTLFTIPVVRPTEAKISPLLVSAQAAVNPNSVGSAPTRNLKVTSPMMRGNDVKWVQAALNLYGNYGLTIDGIYGNASKNACIRFQRAMKLSADGIFGPASKQAMVNWLNRRSSSGSSSSTPLNANLSRVSYMKQGPKACKSTSLAMALNLLAGSNRYTSGSLGGSCCRNINGCTYRATNGVTYRANYKTDSYRGSYSEEINAINTALANGVPIVAAVHSTNRNRTQHHWVLIVGKSGNTYMIVDPASPVSGSSSIANNRKTLSSAGYALGLNDSNGMHYGYITFSR